MASGALSEKRDSQLKLNFLSQFRRVGQSILDWSPEQISGWLKTQYPDDESMRVSHETIYRSLFIQARGVLKKKLMDHLRLTILRASEADVGNRIVLFIGRDFPSFPGFQFNRQFGEGRQLCGYFPCSSRC
jgi:hypothetical protein